LIRKIIEAVPLRDFAIGFPKSWEFY